MWVSRFINKYIGLFGGDNSKVTVWGLSAGGCSVAHLVLSPYTRGMTGEHFILNYTFSDMVSGGIEMSGSAFSSWGVGTTVTENSWELLAVLGCLGSQIKQCLKSKTIDQIYDAVERVGYTTNGLDNIKWGPTIDGDFLPTSPFALARQGRPKPMMVGVGNKDAGYFSLLGYSPYIQNLSIPVSQQANFNQNTLISTMRVCPQWSENCLLSETHQTTILWEQHRTSSPTNDKQIRPARKRCWLLFGPVQYGKNVVYKTEALDSVGE